MEAIKTVTTIIMEQYNFNAPINVNIIYDDDEETHEGITQKENVQSESRQWVNVPSATVGSNSFVQAQAPTLNQIKSYVDSDSLKVVIENMSAIIGAHFKFEQVSKTLSTAELQRFKVKFMEMKYLFFKRSIMVAKFLLLPQKNNEIFIQNIIGEILKKAKVNSNMNSSVRLLYADLIAWTEAQIESERDVGAPKNLDLNATQSNNIETHLNSGHRKRRFPFNEIQETNASKEMLRNSRWQIVMQSTEPNSYPSSRNNDPSNYIPNFTTYYHPQNNNLSEINGLKPVKNIQEQPNHLSEVQVGGNSSNYQKTMQTNISQSLVDNLSDLEKTGASRQDVSRSSISRDSGFMSPDILFSPQESMNTNSQDPSIWHTTTQDTPISNNKRVGSCYVCGRQTDLLCLGCFDYYYCSHMCQKTHWPSHKFKCRNSNSFA